MSAKLRLGAWHQLGSRCCCSPLGLFAICVAGPLKELCDSCLPVHGSSGAARETAAVPQMISLGGTKRERNKKNSVAEESGEPTFLVVFIAIIIYSLREEICFVFKLISCIIPAFRIRNLALTPPDPVKAGDALWADCAPMVCWLLSE